MLSPPEIMHSGRRRQNMLPKRTGNFQQALWRHIQEKYIPLGKQPQEPEQVWNVQSIFTV